MWLVLTIIQAGKHHFSVSAQGIEERNEMMAAKINTDAVLITRVAHLKGLLNKEEIRRENLIAETRWQGNEAKATDNNLPLHRALEKFRKAFTEKSLSESIFNPLRLLTPESIRRFLKVLEKCEN